MLTRRSFAAATVASVLATPALANQNRRLPWKFRPQEVDVNPELPPGQIHVVKRDYFLYWTLGDGRARRYGVAIGADGRNIDGLLTIRDKREWPSWKPTVSMIRHEPHVYGPFAAGLPGGHPSNPMGARALYLWRGPQPTFFRIHGTPQPWTIGTGFSSGCVRLTNEHIEELYEMVPVGTEVFLF